MNATNDTERLIQLETENEALREEINQLKRRNRLLVFSLAQMIGVILVIFIASLLS
jgi:hypothetical protein